MEANHFYAEYIGSQGRIVWTLSDGRNGSNLAPPGLAYTDALCRALNIVRLLDLDATFEFHLEAKPENASDIH
jgi:hypothetical protein